MLHIRVYGNLIELFGQEAVTLPADQPWTVQGVLAYLKQQQPNLSLQQVRLAKNQELVNDGPISSSDELALMPPFAGG